MEKEINFDYYFKKIDKINIKQGDKIIFCDIDGTIFRDSLYIEIFLGVIDALSKFQDVSKILKEYNYSLNKWKNRQWGYDNFLEKIIVLFKEIIQGIPVNFFNDICKKIINEKSKRNYVYPLEMLKAYQKKGFKIILISGSPDNIVSHFAKKHGFDLGLGSFYFKKYITINNNLIFKKGNGISRKERVLTGDNILIATSQSKEKIVNYVKNKYRPSYTISFGDTNGDYNMLNMTDIGYAINPSFELFKKIRNINNIIVIIERKDLVLELNVEQRKNIIFHDNKTLKLS